MELRHLTDQELLTRLEALAFQERENVADVVEHLAELERRDTVADTGCATVYDYCVKVLKYSSSAAFLRIRAARASKTSRRIIVDLRSGSLHLDSVMRLYPHLTGENSDRLLDRASGASKRQVLELVAELGGEKVPERDVIRFSAPATVPEPSPAASSEPAQEILPPAKRIRISFTADDAFLASLDRLKSLQRHRFPSGRLEDILKAAVEAMLHDVDPAREKADVARKKSRISARGAGPRNRRIPRALRRLIWQRDGGCCTFMAPDGRRCESIQFLEVDHIVPFALGGRSDDASNLRLLCRPHNQRLARRRFGPRGAYLLHPDAVGDQGKTEHEASGATGRGAGPR